MEGNPGNLLTGAPAVTDAGGAFVVTPRLRPGYAGQVWIDVNGAGYDTTWNPVNLPLAATAELRAYPVRTLPMPFSRM